eukprot:1161636-Pelagomonas_calceolata.AAC.9
MDAYVQGCQYACSKGQGLPGFWDCCPLLHSRMMQNSTYSTNSASVLGFQACSPMPTPREDCSVICLIFMVEKSEVKSKPSDIAN